MCASPSEGSLVGRIMVATMEHDGSGLSCRGGNVCRIVGCNCISTRKGRLEGRGIMGRLMRVHSVHGGFLSILSSLSFGNVFRGKICNVLEIHSDFIIQKGDFGEPVLKDSDGCDVIFVCRSKTGDFVGKVTRHVKLKSLIECSSVKMGGGTKEKVISLHDSVVICELMTVWMIEDSQ